jgi:hypothetical protein
MGKLAHREGAAAVDLCIPTGSGFSMTDFFTGMTPISSIEDAECLGDRGDCRGDKTVDLVRRAEVVAILSCILISRTHLMPNPDVGLCAGGWISSTEGRSAQHGML